MEMCIYAYTYVFSRSESRYFFVFSTGSPRKTGRRKECLAVRSCSSYVGRSTYTPPYGFRHIARVSGFVDLWGFMAWCPGAHCSIQHGCPQDVRVWKGSIGMYVYIYICIFNTLYIYICVAEAFRTYATNRSYNII